MTSSLQVLYYIAITLAPAGATHVNVTAGSESYGWDRGADREGVATWVYDGAIDPRQVPLNNNIAPQNLARAQKLIGRMGQSSEGSSAVVAFDDAHQLERNSQGYVYVVRPGAPNQKTYSFTFAR